jgi:hypothetical protein
VNLRWWLDKADMRDLRLYTINGLLLLLVWGVARVVLFVPFYVHVLANWVSAVAGRTCAWLRPSCEAAWQKGWQLSLCACPLNCRRPKQVPA